jgi:hypothetical protein
MIEFKWELKQVLSGIKKGLLEKQATFFLRPHDAIWGNTPADFNQLADEIMSLLPDEQMQRQFLSVCLGSYLLNPSKAPKAVTNWIQGRITVAELLGLDVSLDELLSWRWDRAAFPVLDEYENGKNDTIYYALVAKTTSGTIPLYPSWVSDVMNVDALDSVDIAAELAETAQSGSCFFFWPFINPRKPTHDRSLGLPVYLSFLSLAKCKPVPMVIATGEIDRQGKLHPVHGVFDKCDKAFEKNYKKFIYPDDGSCLENRREQRPAGVVSLIEAEIKWGVRNKVTVIDDKDKASLVRHVQTICSAVLGSDNLPCVLISAFDTKHEELPPTITATHEYMIVVDITKVKHLKPLVRETFSSFLGKEICYYKTETLSWLYWGEGEKMSV